MARLNYFVICLVTVVILGTNVFAQSQVFEKNNWKTSEYHSKPNRVGTFLRRHPMVDLLIGGSIGGVIAIKMHKSCTEKYYFYDGKKIPYSGENVPCPVNTYK